MRSLFAVYSLPGKILAHLWYLWPKKGEVWASARRRDHGFVHFLYSTVFYAVIAFILTSPHGSSNRVSPTEAQQFTESQNALPTDDFSKQDAAVDYAPLKKKPVPEAALPPTIDASPEAPPEASGVKFVSNPVVQEVAHPTPLDAPPCSQSVTDGCVQQ